MKHPLRHLEEEAARQREGQYPGMGMYLPGLRIRKETDMSREVKVRRK